VWYDTGRHNTGRHNTGRLGRLAWLGAAVAVTAALAGCSPHFAGLGLGGGGATAPASPPEQPAITVAAVPTAEEGGLYVAQAQGFFRQQGLTVTILPVSGGEAGLRDLQSGLAQLAAGSYVPFILAQQAGEFDGKPVSLRIVAAGSQIQPASAGLYVMPGSKFKTVAQLAQAHATIAVEATDDVSNVLLGALLEQAGGYSLKDIREVVPAGGVTGMIAMLAAGKIAAAVEPQPAGTIAEETAGAVPLADLDQGPLQDFPSAGYIGSTPWVTSHPRTVAAFLRALEEGQQLADTDRAVVEQAMQELAGLPPIVTDTMALDSYPTGMDVPQLQRVPDSMFQFGLTPGAKSPYPIAAMIQPEPGLIG
jgi:NitT/TauT family transport system substrate-binding protein